MSYHNGYEMQQEIFELQDQITKLTIENAKLTVQKDDAKLHAITLMIEIEKLKRELGYE